MELKIRKLVNFEEEIHLEGERAATPPRLRRRRCRWSSGSTQPTRSTSSMRSSSFPMARPPRGSRGAARRVPQVADQRVGVAPEEILGLGAFCQKDGTKAVLGGIKTDLDTPQFRRIEADLDAALSGPGQSDRDLSGDHLRMGRNRAGSAL